MSKVDDSDLEALRSQYEAAYAAYQNHVAALALAQGDEEGVPEKLLSDTHRAIDALRSARRRYRDALMRAAFGS